MVASITHSIFASDFESLSRETPCGPVPFRPSEQRRHHPHLEGPKENCAVDEPGRKRYGRLAFEGGAPPERGGEPGRGPRARGFSRSGNQGAKFVDRGPIVTPPKSGFELQPLQNLFDARGGHRGAPLQTAT